MSYTNYLDFCKRFNHPPISKLRYKLEDSSLSILSDKHFSIGCRIWLFFGRLFNYQKKWDKVRDKSLIDSRKALEQSFTPELQKMLDKDITFKNIRGLNEEIN